MKRNILLKILGFYAKENNAMDLDWYFIGYTTAQFMIVFGLTSQVAEFVNYFDNNKLDRPMSTYFIPDFE